MKQDFQLSLRVLQSLLYFQKVKKPKNLMIFLYISKAEVVLFSFVNYLFTTNW